MKVAFVVQRCGEEVVGGAEALCLQIAEHMAKHWEIEILTTCALDYISWANHYPPGSDEKNGVRIRRFSVDHERNVPEFDKLSVQLAAKPKAAPVELQETWMCAQGPISSALLQFIETAASDYNAFVFFGYLYATTFFGLPLVAEKAWLAPLGHDEWPIYLSIWDKLFARPRGFIFQTEEEQSFLQHRFTHPLQGPVIGVGVTPPVQTAPSVFRERYDLEQPFLLYVGRVDAAKGCATLFDNFSRAHADGALTHKLAIIGTEVMPVPLHEQIIYLGTVPDEEKWDAMAAAEWLVMPSPHESLSIAVLEAWAVARPSIVNARSDVLVSHCRSSNGGLWYDGYDAWRAIFSVVDGSIANRLGAQGQRYVAQRYTWPRVEEAYLNLAKAFTLN